MTIASAVTEKQFRRIAEVAHRLWGLSLDARKIHLVSSRMQRFLRRTPFESVDAYLEHLDRADERERLAFFDLLSTNVTSFFRERAAFDFLERELWTPLAKGTLTLPGKRIRIWSAACSIGCEPYSLAMHAREHLLDGPEGGGWDLRILGSDLATSALRTARDAVYPAPMLEHLDGKTVRRFFVPEPGDTPAFRVAEAVRRLVVLRRINLVGDWPVKGPLDVIFCRNVMIYFDRETRARLVSRLAGLLRPGGMLVVGSSETLAGIEAGLIPVQPSVYVR